MYDSKHDQRTISHMISAIKSRDHYMIVMCRLTDSRDNIAAEDDVLLHSRISQIKITILQTLKFVRLTAAIDFKRKLVIPASAKNFDLFRDDFNFSGILLRIGIGAGTNRTFHRDGGLLVDSLHLGNLEGNGKPLQYSCLENPTKRQMIGY